jgi:transcriptional regulator with XRE-family HTH domain
VPARTRPTLYAALGARLRSIRIVKNLKQEDMARVLDVRPNRVKDWEVGVGRPPANTLACYARQVGIATADLLRGSAECERSIAELLKAQVLERKKPRVWRRKPTPPPPPKPAGPMPSDINANWRAPKRPPPAPALDARAGKPCSTAKGCPVMLGWCVICQRMVDHRVYRPELDEE